MGFTRELTISSEVLDEGDVEEEADEEAHEVDEEAGGVDSET